MLENIRRTKIPLPADRYQEFGTCCLFHFLVPLLPFGWEHLKDGHISPSTLTVGSAVYVLAIGVSSREQIIFAISILFAFCDMLLFPLLTEGIITARAYGSPWVWGSLAFVVFSHMCERFNRHVMDREPYFEFMRARRAE